MLCGRDETGETILAQPGWLYELKLDGVRIVADKRGKRVALSYRKGRDATDSYPEIAEAVGTIDETRLVLDGEIVAFAEDGRPDFQRLGTRIQSRGSNARRAASRVPVVYVVFDVLVVGDHDVTRLPIESRKAILERIVEGATSTNGHLRLQPTLPDGKQLFRFCREKALEGVVAKRSGSIYRPDDRSTDWVKVKCELDADLVVIGWTAGEGTRSVLGALELGAYDGDRLVVCGSVGSGLGAATIEALADRLTKLATAGPVAEGKYRAKRGLHHVRPEIVVSVRHMGLTADGHLRHPVFRGVRHDVLPEDCTLAGAAGTASR
jgi:bifunctional non-homologous end joining protein LigD